MPRLRRIYVVATKDRDTHYCSLGRSWSDASRVAAFSTPEAAILAEARGEVFVPGYLIGESSPLAMSTASTEAIVERLSEIGLTAKGGPLDAYAYDDGIELWPRGTSLWFEELTTEQLAALRALFDRHADPAIVGRRDVYTIDVE